MWVYIIWRTTEDVRMYIITAFIIVSLPLLKIMNSYYTFILYNLY